MFLSHHQFDLSAHRMTSPSSRGFLFYCFCPGTVIWGTLETLWPSDEAAWIHNWWIYVCTGEEGHGTGGSGVTQHIYLGHSWLHISECAEMLILRCGMSFWHPPIVQFLFFILFDQRQDEQLRKGKEKEKAASDKLPHAAPWLQIGLVTKSKSWWVRKVLIKANRSEQWMNKSCDSVRTG